MSTRMFAAGALCVVALGVGAGNAQQQPAANPMDAIPDKMPFNTPYGPPISLQRAQAKRSELGSTPPSHSGGEKNKRAVGILAQERASARPLHFLTRAEISESRPGQ